MIQGAKNVLQFHKNSVVKALVSLFPDVSFDTTKFIHGNYFYFLFYNFIK